MKLFGKMKIFEKIENRTSASFMKWKRWLTSTMVNEQLFSLCMIVKKSLHIPHCKISVGAFGFQH